MTTETLPTTTQSSPAKRELPHWVYCPNWARGVPENELRALAGDR